MELRNRRLAIVLLDLIGSTAFVQRVGAMRAATWLQYHDRLARSLLYRFEGREIDRSDGFLLSFERPIDALNFALHYQAQIPQKTKLGARIGVHYGDVVEVTQDELYSAVGAKSVELEGIAKNIAARAMSVCEAGQVILTRDAMRAVRNRTNPSTPKGTRFACVGLYRFKGVSAPVTLYAVGDTIESLQPPRGNEKAKRVGGAKAIKSRARHRRWREWALWSAYRLAWISVGYILAMMYPWMSNRDARHLWGVTWLDWFDYIAIVVEAIREAFKQW
jgi:class 3 adenylate cyclase